MFGSVHGVTERESKKKLILYPTKQNFARQNSNANLGQNQAIYSDIFYTLSAYLF